MSDRDRPRGRASGRAGDRSRSRSNDRSGSRRSTSRDRGYQVNKFESDSTTFKLNLCLFLTLGLESGR